MKSSVLAVGTELTSGQITNRNSSWISQKLTQLGVQTGLHLTVADERAAIQEALQLIEKKSDLLFITGGLGPTSDDFTRDLVSEWLDQPLEFHEPSWRKIQDRLNERGLPIEEFQKQQCYFPKGSRVLENTQGTANAFYFQKDSKHVWVLPGPPREIEAVWKDHISTQLTSLTRNLNPYVTHSWDVLGLGEAVAPTLIEPAVKGSQADIGYRVHMPYLEIKFSHFKSDSEKMKPYLQKIEAALQGYTVQRDGEDILTPLRLIFEKAPHLYICDEVTQGHLYERIQSIRKTNLTYTTDPTVQPPLFSWQLYCRYKNDLEFDLVLHNPPTAPLEKKITGPFSHSPHMSERRRQYFAELALITAAQHWRSL